MENKLLLYQKNVSLAFNPTIMDKLNTRKEDSIFLITFLKSHVEIMDSLNLKYDPD